MLLLATRKSSESIKGSFVLLRVSSLVIQQARRAIPNLTYAPDDVYNLFSLRRAKVKHNFDSYFTAAGNHTLNGMLPFRNVPGFNDNASFVSASRPLPST